MSNEHIYMLNDETSDDEVYLIGIFESLEKANEFLATIDKPLDESGSDYQKLVLREIEINKVEWSLWGTPVLKFDIEKVLIDGAKDEEGWEVTEWRWKELEHVPGKWELVDVRRVEND